MGLEEEEEGGLLISFEAFSLVFIEMWIIVTVCHVSVDALYRRYASTKSRPSTFDFGLWLL